MNITSLVNKKIILFAIFGFLQVGIDFSIYTVLYYLTNQVSLSKSISIIFCIVISYYLNKKFTFNNASKNVKVFYQSMLVYAASMLINVGINSLIFNYLKNFLEKETTLIIAFIIATFCSASLNFIGLNFVMKK